MARAVMTVGSAASFVVAAVAGVLGNQLTKDALWAWIAFGVALLVGAGVTAFVAHRGTARPELGEPAGADQLGAGGDPAQRHQQAEDQAPEPEPHTIEGPVARKGDITLKGKYVAGHDMTVTRPARPRGKKR